MDPALYQMTKESIEQSYEAFTEVLGRLAANAPQQVLSDSSRLSVHDFNTVLHSPTRPERVELPTF